MRCFAPMWQMVIRAAAGASTLPARAGVVGSKNEWYWSPVSSTLPKRHGTSVSWKEHHRQSAHLASEPEQALRGNETAAARDLYARAADAEERALAHLDIAKQRTLGISVVSAAALHYKAHDFAKSQAVACGWLAKAVLPDFAVEQLKTLLETIWAKDLRGGADSSEACRRPQARPA